MGPIADSGHQLQSPVSSSWCRWLISPCVLVVLSIVACDTSTLNVDSERFGLNSVLFFRTQLNTLLSKYTKREAL